MIINSLFYKQPYAKEFDAVVVTCIPVDDMYAVTLDRTLFYPEGGGQPSDTGTLDGLRVLDVQESSNIIIHYLAEPLGEGLMVHGVIDWEHRFRLMQCHTAEHIVTGLIHQKYGYENVGFHMSDVVTIDLNGPIEWDDLKEIEKAANQIVYDDVPVLALVPNANELSTMEYRSKKELVGTVRIIKIPGADSCACCGIHVNKTGEIGSIKLLSMMNHRGGVRIAMTAGFHAMLDYQEKHEQCVDISRLLSVKPDEIVSAVEKLKIELKDRDQRIADLNRKYFQLKANSYEKGQDLIFETEPLLSGVEIRLFCEILRKADKAKISAVVSGTKQEGYYYCIASNSVDLRKASKELNQTLNGRGGGSPQMIQGTFHASIEEIKNALLAIINQ